MTVQVLLCVKLSPTLQEFIMSMDEKVWLNVGGTRFWTKWSTVLRPMCSRLSRLNLSDPEYDPQANEFCFDRSGILFDCILDVHRTGNLHIPHDICVPRILEEIDFWEIPVEKVAGCCWLRIRDSFNTLKRVRKLHNTLVSAYSNHYSCETTADMKDSLNSKSRPSRDTGFYFVSRELLMSFASAVDKPFSSRKAKVSIISVFGYGFNTTQFIIQMEK